MRYKKTITKEGEEKVKRSSKLPVEVTFEEFVEILKAVKSVHHKYCIFVAYESGLRVSEVINLKKEDFNFEKKEIRINGGKGDKDRIVNLPVNWQPHMINYFPPECSKRALQKAFENACISSGVKAKKPSIHFHSLRHSYATRLVRSGAKLSYVQQMLGHSDLSTTSVYLRMSPQEAIKNVYEVW